MIKRFPWLRDILFLGIIAVLIVVFTVVPYFNRKATEKALRKDEQYQCRLTTVLREFAETAADVRFTFAKTENPRLHRVNLHAAKVYAHVSQELKKIPVHDCQKTLK